ncbi:MAG: TetR family transcriptional regulator [Alphaproteobacteria bacterium]|nr:TetR family transcriptional regulator [Alphaproteobacteria bacterium]
MSQTLLVPRRARRQAERRAQSDAELLSAAAAVIAEEGYAAATFDRIGARSGYSRGLASQRFGSKDGLIAALIARLHEGFDALLADIEHVPANGLEALLMRVDLFFRSLPEAAELRAYFVMFAGVVGDLSEQRSAFAASHQIAKARFAEQIAAGQADGSIAADLNVDATAIMVGSVQLGASLQYLADPKTDLDALRLATLRALKRGLKAR